MPYLLPPLLVPSFNVAQGVLLSLFDLLFYRVSGEFSDISSPEIIATSEIVRSGYSPWLLYSVTTAGASKHVDVKKSYFVSIVPSIYLFTFLLPCIHLLASNSPFQILFFYTRFFFSASLSCITSFARLRVDIQLSCLTLVFLFRFLILNARVVALG